MFELDPEIKKDIESGKGAEQFTELEREAPAVDPEQNKKHLEENKATVSDEDLDDLFTPGAGVGITPPIIEQREVGVEQPVVQDQAVDDDTILVTQAVVDAALELSILSEPDKVIKTIERLLEVGTYEREGHEVSIWSDVKYMVTGALIEAHSSGEMLPQVGAALGKIVEVLGDNFERLGNSTRKDIERVIAAAARVRDRDQVVTEEPQEETGMLSAVKSAINNGLDYLKKPVRFHLAILQSRGCLGYERVDGKLVLVAKHSTKGGTIREDPKDVFHKHTGKDNKYYQIFKDIKDQAAARGVDLKVLTSEVLEEAGIWNIPAIYIDPWGDAELRDHHRIGAILENADLGLSIQIGVLSEDVSFN